MPLKIFTLIIIAVLIYGKAEAKPNFIFQLLMNFASINIERVDYEVPNFDDTTFGFEFEFSKDKYMNHWDPKVALIAGSKEALFDGEEPLDAKRMADYVKKLCKDSGDCTVKAVKHKHSKGEYLVTFKDNYWIRISFDPACVEVQGKPITENEYIEKRSLLQKYIFDAAQSEEVGLTIDKKEGMGHFNIGARSAFSIGRSFKSYFIDYQNTPELSLGAIGNNLGGNAPPLSQLNQSQRDALQEITTVECDMPQCAQLINQKVYTHSTDDKYTKAKEGYAHYQAVGLRNFNLLLNLSENDPKDVPLELRAIYSQKSIDDFILLIKLFKLRNRFLFKEGYPVTYLNIARGRYTKIQLVSRFYVYVTEAGGSFSRFKQLLREDLQDIRPDNFVLYGDLNLNLEQDYKIALNHLPYVKTSKFIRNSFIKVLNDPKNKNAKFADLLSNNLMGLVESKTCAAIF